MKKLIVSGVASLLALAVAAPSAAATTVGNPADPAPVVDTCTVCTFVVNEAFGVAGQRVASYNFYANNAAQITPFLATRTDVGSIANFTVTGIGQERTAAVGVNTFAFGPVAGSDVTTANTYFGFAYDAGGVVAYRYTSSAEGTFVGPPNYFPTLGGTFSADFSSQAHDSYSKLNDRIYSINATAVPEPATWAMMLGGFGLVGGAIRQRRRKPQLATATA